jgi:hypothetical protein
MSGDDVGPQLEVRRDGVAVLPAELGSPIPVDPGEHTIEAVAPGKQAWTAKIQVGADSSKVAVEIPKLQAATGAQAPAGGPVAAPAAAPNGAVTPPPKTPDNASNSGQGMRTAGLVLGGVGVVGIGLGGFFGLRASSKWSDAKGKCHDFPYDCGTDGTDLQSSAKSAATVSTVAFIAGGALLGTGLVLFLTAPKREQVALSVGPGSVALQGSFQ